MKIANIREKGTSTITPKINYHRVCLALAKSSREKYTGSRVVGSCVRTYFPDIQSTVM